MIAYYIMRDVEPGAVCSYRRGRTYVDEVYRTAEAAQRRVDCYNHFAAVEGIRYVVLPHSDTTALPFDYFEPQRAPKLERVFVD